MARADGQLATEACTGDAAAFASLAERHRPRVERLSRQLLPHGDAAQDCVQLTLVRAWERIGQLQDPARFGGWLMSICRSVAANLREAEGTRRAREQEASRGPRPVPELDRIITRLWVRQAVDKLPELYRRPVHQHYFDGLSHADIARRLHVPVTTVKKRLHDARGRLKEALGEMAEAKKLAGLSWQQRWISHLGCIKGCLEHLGIDMSWGWLYGGSGHAFLLSIHKELCPSGPTMWDWGRLWALAKNLGVEVDGPCISRHCEAAAFPKTQEQAWGMVRAAIDEGRPCFGWELALPEFYTIHGYDEVGYYFSGPGAEPEGGPKPWREAGASEIGLLALLTVRPGRPAPPEQIVGEALRFAVEFAGQETPEPDAVEHRAGLAGYEAWAEALESGVAGRFGLGLNAACWAECRREAVNFLREAKTALLGRAAGPLEEAMLHYSVVHSRLEAVSDLYPFQPPSAEQQPPVEDAQAAVLVREAAAAEEQALHAVRGVLEAL
jgi:RNA polymerase sigma-70 factor (ECF subfamily)